MLQYKAYFYIVYSGSRFIFKMSIYLSYNEDIWQNIRNDKNRQLRTTTLIMWFNYMRYCFVYHFISNIVF